MSGNADPRVERYTTAGYSGSMQPRFPLGKIVVKEDAAVALQSAGQDASFFLAKHASGDWGEAPADVNERGLAEGSMALSRYRTLWGHDLYVITFLEKGETVLFLPPNSLFRYEPLPDMACWYPGGKRPDEVDEMKPTGGNGSSKFTVVHEDMGGWVRVFVPKLPAISDELGLYLSTALANWFRAHPQVRLRCVVPIQKDGNTVELHGWYDMHVFPATPLAPSAAKG